MVINLIYGIFTDLVMAVLNMSVNVGQTMLFVFNLSVDLIPIKSESSNNYSTYIVYYMYLFNFFLRDEPLVSVVHTYVLRRP